MKTHVIALLAGLVLAGCAAPSTPPSPPQSGAPEVPASVREDTRAFTLAAGEGLEYKLSMDEGQSMTFEWSAPKPLNFDFHGDQEANPDDFTSYKTGTLVAHGGDFTAPFTGRHGWWWENKNREPVTVTLHTSGTYGVVGITSGG